MLCTNFNFNKFQINIYKIKILIITLFYNKTKT